MNSGIQFSPVVPLYWLLPVTAILIIALCWLESKKPYRFRALRVVAQALAIISLLIISLRPSWQVQVLEGSVVLLTQNFSKRALDSLLKADPALKAVRAPGVTAPGVSDSLGSFREMGSQGAVRFVLGDGVPVAFLDYTRGHSFRFISGHAPVGVTSLYVKDYPEFRRCELTGSVRGSKGGRLTLKGPGGAEDSVEIHSNDQTSFSLRFKTKIPGRYVYTLRLRDSVGQVIDEQVPVEVISSRKLSVLLLQNYPTTEVRFLKNYLTEKGHRLVTRYQLSRNIYRYEVANGAEKPTGALDGDKLLRFDLVVADDGTLKDLSAGEQRDLEAAVREGIGLLVLLNGVGDARRFPGDLLQLTPIAGAPDTVRYTVQGFGSYTGPFVGIRSGKQVQTMLQGRGFLLQGLALHGLGKVSIQTLRETYRLALGGDNSAYAALWTPLLEQAARREAVANKVQVTTLFPIYPGEPVSFDMISEHSPKVSVDGTPLPLAEDVAIDDLWHGRYWAGGAGWASFDVGKQDHRNYFVSKPGSWKSVRRSVQQKSNALVSRSSATTIIRKGRKEMSLLLFFLLFLICQGFVWLAPKV